VPLSPRLRSTSVPGSRLVRTFGQSLAVVSLVSVAWSLPSEAEILTRCGASEGTAYFFPGPAVPREKSGWSADKITDGEILLSVEGNEKVDIIYKDVTGMRTLAGEGFHLFAFSGDDALLVVAIHPAGPTLEHFLFRLDGSGRGVVVWGTARAGALLQKSSLMTAGCAKP
jgi:hypothetical protein